MSFPVVRLLTGAQPLAATSADQFLGHFAPYFGLSLLVVTVLGGGAYTFKAFALQAASFWIHVQSTILALLGRRGGFVVTPKEGAEGRQPRAVAPALAAIAVLCAVGAYGLLRDRDPATLNNVAFAALHVCVLAAGRVARAAARRRFPPRLRSRCRSRREAARARRCGARGRALGGCGGSEERFLDRYVDDDGRVVRHDQGGDTVSEGQAYAMLLAVAADDRDRFAQVWDWTRAHLQRGDGLLAWRWAGGRVVDDEPATDADLDAARALYSPPTASTSPATPPRGGAGAAPSPSTRRRTGRCSSRGRGRARGPS